jgi:hypothetical protein
LLADEVGVYRVVQEFEGRQRVNHFVVNLFRPEESDLSPSALPSVRTEIAEEQSVPKIPWEMAPWLALTALAILSLEWWVYRHGY